MANLYHIYFANMLSYILLELVIMLINTTHLYKDTSGAVHSSKNRVDKNSNFDNIFIRYIQIGRILQF